jgi:predicted Ser/Thr protein kinase
MPSHMMSLFGSKKLRVTEQISKGGFGFVYKGFYEGREVAVKRLIAPQTKKAKLRLARMFGISYN